MVKMKDLSFLKQNLIAHRGIHSKYPENSLEAFNEAVKKNYTIELDVHLLNDNSIIVFHDDNLKRMTGINKKLKDLNYEEIKDIKLKNSKSKIPLLKDVLKQIKCQVPIIIELKSDRKTSLLERELVKILDNYKGKFCVKSFNVQSIRWLKKHRTNYIRGLLLKKKDAQNYFKTKFLLWLCKPDFLSCNYRSKNNKLIKNQHKKRVIIAWTINNDEVYLKCKDEFDNLIMDFDLDDKKHI